MKNLRHLERTRTLSTHPDFDFVKPGSENLFINGLGEFGAGKVFTELSDYEHYSTAKGLHIFVRCHSEEVRERFRSLESTFMEMARSHNNTTTLHNCTRKHVVVAYENKYGRDGLE